MVTNYTPAENTKESDIRKGIMGTPGICKLWMDFANGVNVREAVTVLRILERRVSIDALTRQVLYPVVSSNFQLCVAMATLPSLSINIQPESSG